VAGKRILIQKSGFTRIQLDIMAAGDGDTEGQIDLQNSCHSEGFVQLHYLRGGILVASCSVCNKIVAQFKIAES
jgi:hypothetical protein